MASCLSAASTRLTDEASAIRRPSSSLIGVPLLDDLRERLLQPHLALTQLVGQPEDLLGPHWMITVPARSGAQSLRLSSARA